MLEYVWVLPLLTFLSFFVILFLGRRLPRGGAEVGVAALVVCFVLSCVAVAQWVGRPAELEVEAHHEAETAQAVATPVAVRAQEAPEEPGGGAGQEGGGAEAEGEDGEVAETEHIRGPVVRETTWFEFGGVEVKAGIHVDGFTVAMLFMVSLVSLMVHVFSTSYMHDDRRFTHYFAGLSLFTTGMFVLVTSSNTLQALIGWELMGLCSFLLIGHWWEEKKNSDAALKAFFTTRVGDVGLMVGISILFFAADRSFDIARTNRMALEGEIGHGVLVWAAAFLLLAVTGKSAQFPLHTWLPDAMAGPTPVSALIHAATMVVAGVYLAARLYGVFWEGFSIPGAGVNALAVVGGITILIAALLAFVQSDIKRVLAYSTVSQLGFMVMALGVGAWTAAVFHIFTHAMFKACLFLGSGSAAHAVHGFDMKQDMGGLKAYMPTTFWTFLIGSAALAGVPPLAGFWSKDEILLGAGEGGYEFFLVVGLVGALMTAAYMTRCIWLTFFGRFRGHGHPHESPSAITGPLVVLAFFSVTAGLLNAPGIELFGKWTENQVFFAAGIEHHEFSLAVAGLSVLVAVVGIGAAYLWYWRQLGPQRLTERNGLAAAGYRLLDNRYYLDHLYTGAVVGSIKGPIARAAYWVNQNVIDGVLNGTAYLMRRLGRFTYDVIDQRVVDGLVNGTGFTAEEGGGLLRTIQTGRVQQYAAIFFAAAAMFAVALVVLT